jgi:hypothetical protein
MIKVEDMIKVHGQWFDVMIEIFPCKSHYNRSHRYFGEVLARTTDWPDGDDRGIWNHYWMLDYGKWTLRGAYWQAHEKVWELHDYLEAHPDDLPTHG